MHIGTVWLHMHDCVTVVFCLTGPADEYLDSNSHGNWVWVRFEIVPPDALTRREYDDCVVVETAFLERVRHVSYPLIHTRGNPGVYSSRVVAYRVLVRHGIPGWYLVRAVCSLVCQIQEKWLETWSETLFKLTPILLLAYGYSTVYTF